MPVKRLIYNELDNCQFARNMKHRNQLKRSYSSPRAWFTGVEFEVALLIASGLLNSEVDELEHRYSTMNEDGTPSSASGEPLYFEF